MFPGHMTAIFCIIATEFCERFSFCGLRTILSLYLRNVLCLHENASTVIYHIFIMLCYTMPLVGAILADNFLGRYKVILYFSVIYFFGTLLTCCSAIPLFKLPPTTTSMIGLALIAMGTGGIKPCVAAFGGEQFRLPDEERQLQRFFSTFYCTVNLGGLMGMVLTPMLRRGVMCFGDDTCYALGFGFPTVLVLLSIVIFAAGKPWYIVKQPRENVTLKFVACAWYAAKMRLRQFCRKDRPPESHWLNYSLDKYGSKLVTDMKIVFSILYLYLPVPIFWSLFDQQGSRWTFQASRLRNELFGLTLMPDQLQVLNPALVLLMIPVCPGGTCPLLPDLPPLTKMFIGGMLTSMAFYAAGILQVGIERSTLQAPGRHQSGLVVLSTLPCPLEVKVPGAASALLPPRGCALLAPLPHAELPLHAVTPRHVHRRELTALVKMQAGQFMPVVIGQDSADNMKFYYMDPNAFSKSLSGKPKLKLVYLGGNGANKNVSISIETDNQLIDTYYVSDSPIDDIGESAYMHLAPGTFTWQARDASGLLGGGAGTLRAGGVYVMSVRARDGRIDAVQLHAPNPPNELHLAWLLPQYVLISSAEIMFAISGLEFSFTQAPKSMKTITIAAWYMSVAVGNFIVILVAQAKLFESRATEFFIYASVLAIAMILFLKMAQGFQPRSLDDEDYSEESAPLLHGLSKVISVRSVATSSSRAFTGATSGASCLGLMERAPPERRWPPFSRVHLATPTDSDEPATTLARFHLKFSNAGCVEVVCVASYSDSEMEQLDRKFDDVQMAVFSRKAYPEPGDIPVLNRKIFRGTRVQIHEHPYAVSIRRLHAHYVTGAILSVTTVVTVAHPVYNVPVTELGVVAGETYCDRGASYMTVLLVLTHQRFDPYTLQADLALLRLYEAIYRQYTQKPISLYTEPVGRLKVVGSMRKQLKTIGHTAFVTGWGRCDWMGTEMCLPRSSLYFPDEKQDPILTTVSFNHSNIYRSQFCVGYEKHKIEVKSDNGMLCLGPAREIDPLAPCMAVPGAALTVRGQLLGLQSWGFGCGFTHDLPLIYTDLRYYAKWVKSNLNILNTLNVDHVSQLYIATKAYFMRNWLAKTSTRRPHMRYTPGALQDAAIDRKLVFLAGNVTDFRDHAYGGALRIWKADLYASILAEAERNQKLKDISEDAWSHSEPLRSFLNVKYQGLIENSSSVKGVIKRAINTK